MQRDTKRATILAAEPFALVSEPATVKVWKRWNVDGEKHRQPELFVDRMGNPDQQLLFGDVQPSIGG